jgi:hypothetical protein
MRFVWLSLFAIAAFGCGNHDGGSGGNGGPDAGPTFPCVGLACKQVQCPNAGTTSISGTVFAPNGTLPIYGATVYVPNRPVDPITSGATCDRCANLSGDPIARTVTDESGKFVLQNMPVATDVPVVIQVGKWRRQITVPAVPGCVDTAIDTGVTRLPKNKTEGDIPLMALTTGEYDALECLLRKIGLDDSEFTTAGGNGRVHLFSSLGGSDKFDAARGGGTFAAATSLWSTEQSLSTYDVVFMSCEGGQDIGKKPQTSRAAMKSYADKGGRVFASHWHNVWLEKGPPPWNQAISWNLTLDDLGNVPVDINPNFPKSMPLTNWLRNVGALNSDGKLELRDTQHTALSVDPTYAESWIQLATTANNLPSVQYASMVTPIEKPDAIDKCGRVVYSDIHVSTADDSAPSKAFPSQSCTTDVKVLTEQEKVLAFMIFDIASCVGDPIE